MQPSAGWPDELEAYADLFASEQHIDCSDRLAIHLKLSYFQNQLNLVATDRPLQTIHSPVPLPEKKRTAAHLYG